MALFDREQGLSLQCLRVDFRIFLTSNDKDSDVRIQSSKAPWVTHFIIQAQWISAQNCPFTTIKIKRGIIVA
jgi:hypothetical protein